jgi:hypothetical protein
VNALALLLALQQPQLTPLPGRQQFLAIVLASTILVLVLELVRRRKLREEYAWVWIAVSLVLFAIAADEDVIVAISRLIGSATGTSTLFFGAILFLLLLALQFSVRLSRLTHRSRTLAQRMALLEQELDRLRAQAPPSSEVVPMRPPTAVAAPNPPRAKDGSA